MFFSCPLFKKTKDCSTTETTEEHRRCIRGKGTVLPSLGLWCSHWGALQVFITWQLINQNIIKAGHCISSEKQDKSRKSA